jgi:hypothetical protein
VDLWLNIILGVALLLATYLSLKTRLTRRGRIVVWIIVLFLFSANVHNEMEQSEK